MADRKAVVKNADMSEDMKQDSINIAKQVMKKFNFKKDIAAFKINYEGQHSYQLLHY